MSDIEREKWKIPKTIIETPFHKGKIPLDELHECPMCQGRGYVGIVPETIPVKPDPGIV